MTFDSIIDTLNVAFKADPDAIRDLIRHRVSCNRALADHPTIQVSDGMSGSGFEDEPSFSVGLLGMLNGVIEPLTGERIAFRWDDSGKPLGFCRYTGGRS